MASALRPVSLATLSIALTCACSGAPPEAPPAPPRPTRAAAALPPKPSATPRAAPQLTGLPVVLAARKPTAVAGVEWAFLLPEARMVTLMPEDAAGHRAIWGPAFFAGPNNKMITIDAEGALVLADGAGKHNLGKWSYAGFDAGGHNILAWDARDWALFSSSGKRLMGDRLVGSEPKLLPSGLVVQWRDWETRLVRPPNSALYTRRAQCNELLSYNKRIVCRDGRGTPKPTISIASLETGEAIALVNDTASSREIPGMAVRSDGGALAYARDEVKIVDIREGNGFPQPRIIARNLPYVSRKPPRLAFTADGALLCVEAGDKTRVIKTAGLGGAYVPPKGRQGLCLFSRQSPAPVEPRGRSVNAEWDVRLVLAPVHADYEPLVRYPWPATADEVVIASADGKTIAYLEQKRATSSEGMRWHAQAVILDAVTSAERLTFAVGSQLLNGTGFDAPKIELSPDGRSLRVCSSTLYKITDRCRTFDTATGGAAATPLEPAPHPTVSSLHASYGEAPSARVADVSQVLPARAANAPTVTSWTDQGAYLTIDIDAGGGVIQRLNLKDSAVRTAEEVLIVGSGDLLAVAAQGSVVLWSLDPVALAVLLVPADGGVAALFPDGTFEAIGGADAAVRCQQGEDLVPVGQCGEMRAPAGTLAGLLR